MSELRPHKVMLISGARKGIGRFLAEHYLAEGWRVVGCSRGPSDLRHDHYRHAQLDVGNEEAVVTTISEVRNREGRLDALLNNAGVASMNHFLLTPAATVESIMRTNYLGTFLLSREGAKLMRGNGGGRIINFSSIGVPLRLEGEAAYNASKAAVAELSEILARELAPFSITVNVVGPTPIETDLIRNVPKASLDRLLKRQAIPRLGSFADVVNVTDFYLRPESCFITGQTIYLGGVC